MVAEAGSHVVSELVVGVQGEGHVDHPLLVGHAVLEVEPEIGFFEPLKPGVLVGLSQALEDELVRGTLGVVPEVVVLLHLRAVSDGGVSLVEDAIEVVGLLHEVAALLRQVVADLDQVLVVPDAWVSFEGRVKLPFIVEVDV